MILIAAMHHLTHAMGIGSLVLAICIFAILSIPCSR
jgi:hypothetical protein